MYWHASQAKGIQKQTEIVNRIIIWKVLILRRIEHKQHQHDVDDIYQKSADCSFRVQFLFDNFIRCNEQKPSIHI